MNTIKKNQKIDHTQWVTRGEWNNHQAAILIAGLDPDDPHYREAPLSQFYQFPLGNGKKGESAKKLYEKILPTWKDLNFNRWVNHPFRYIDKALCKRIEVDENLLSEIKKQFLNESRHDKNLGKLYPCLAESTDDGRATGIDCSFCGHDYSTSLLRITGKALTHFWVNRSPREFPAKDDVVNWLKDTWKKGKYKGELSDHMAKAIDSIIRHDERKKGGNIPSK